MSDAATPPTPDGVPLLGNGMAFSRDPLGALEAWASHGNVVRLRFPGQSMYMVTDPDLIREVLVERHGEFTIGRAQREAFSDIEDDAVTASTGDKWQRLRRALHPAFTWDRIESYGARMARRTADHIDRWGDEPFDLHREMRLLTIRILGDTLLGVDLDGDERMLMDAADALVDGGDPRRFGQLLPDWVPTPTDRRFERRVAALDDYVKSVLDDGSPGDDDVRSILLAVHDCSDLSMAEVEDNLVGLLLGGHDSLAVTLTYAWLELGRNPGIEEAVAAEIEAVVGDGLPAANDFEALERVRNVVRETLRLYPPAWASNREATEPVTLGGYDLPAGAQLTLPQWVLHRDDRYWDDPGTFDPDRWTRDREQPEYAYFPFSGGPRHCIGMRFARLELVMAIATTVGRVSLDVTTDGPLSFRPSLSLRPNVDIQAIASPR
jgi:cytochrome P450